MLVFLVLTSVLGFLIYALYLRYGYVGRLLAKIPGPPGVPFFGNAFQLAALTPETTFAYVRKLNKEYGEINKLYSGHVAAVNISNPDYVEKILSNPRLHHKKNIYNFMKPWLGDGLGLSNGEKWKQRRRMFAPTFHITILKEFCNTFNDHAERLMEKVQDETENDYTSVLPLFMRTSVSIMCETVFGISLDSGEDPIVEAYLDSLHKLGDIILKRVMNIWLHEDAIFNLTPLSRQQQKLITSLHGLTDLIIEKKKETRKNGDINRNFSESKKRLALLDLLFEEEEKGNIDMLGIREETDTFLFGGHDTVGMAMSYMVMRLANETEIQEKIFEELTQIFGDSMRTPTSEDLNEMKYLECCIKEMMRIYTPAHLLARHLTEEVEIGKYKVPAGVTMLIHAYDIHHNPSIYPDPERFIPERFLPENSTDRHPYAFIPFSAGPRNCIGWRFAMLEVKIMLSGILRRFHLEPVTRAQDVKHIPDIVLRPDRPLYVRFKRR